MQKPSKYDISIRTYFPRFSISVLTLSSSLIAEKSLNDDSIEIVVKSLFKKEMKQLIFNNNNNKCSTSYNNNNNKCSTSYNNNNNKCSTSYNNNNNKCSTSYSNNNNKCSTSYNNNNNKCSTSYNNNNNKCSTSYNNKDITAIVKNALILCH